MMHHRNEKGQLIVFRNDSGELQNPRWNQYVYQGEFKGGINRICSHFGCASRLSLIEQLAGTKCTAHMNLKQINITNTIKRP